MEAIIGRCHQGLRIAGAVTRLMAEGLVGSIAFLALFVLCIALMLAPGMTVWVAREAWKAVTGMAG